MTTSPLRETLGTRRRLRVITGTKTIRRRAIAPWFALIVVLAIAMFGLAFSRTALDRSALELSRLESAIAEAEVTNEQLELEVARKESPVRIAPLAEGLGLVVPDERRPISVEGVVEGPLGVERASTFDIPVTETKTVTGNSQFAAAPSGD